MKIKYIAKKEDDNKLLKDILKNKLYISNILMRKLKLTKSILVNNTSKHLHTTIFKNEIITLDFENMNTVIYTDKTNECYKKDKYLDKYSKFCYNLNIIYEDDYILVINKPYNMPSHPSCTNHETTLSNAVATYLEKQGIYSIHMITRLDKNTSGICIFAKNEYIQELFIRMKNDLNLQKEYLAIVNGIVENDHDIIEENIARKSDSIILRQVSKSGDYAKTEYFVNYRDFDKNYTILKIILHTGRTHQIRVHMSHIGHTILGDTLYANEYNIKDIDSLIKRQALHAYKITFMHPITQEKIVLKAPIPNDIKNC